MGFTELGGGLSDISSDGWEHDETFQTLAVGNSREITLDADTDTLVQSIYVEWTPVAGAGDRIISVTYATDTVAGGGLVVAEAILPFIIPGGVTTYRLQFGINMGSTSALIHGTYGSATLPNVILKPATPGAAGYVVRIFDRGGSAAAVGDSMLVRLQSVKRKA